MTTCNKDHLIKNKGPPSHVEMHSLGAAKFQGPLEVAWENSKLQVLNLQMPGVSWIMSVCPKHAASILIHTSIAVVSSFELTFLSNRTS